MSADNSICVLETIARDGRPEYRVAHVQNVEMTEWHVKKERDEYLRSYFTGCRVFRDGQVAFSEAARLYRREHFVEYGIVEVKLGEPFPGVTVSPARKGAKASAPKRRRVSRSQRRIKTLTRRVYELRGQLAVTVQELDDVRKEKDRTKAEIFAALENVMIAHR